MGRPRRQQEPDGIYVVSNRCIDGRAFFRPGPEVNTITERALVWAADKHDIDLYAYIFELNEFELILGAPRLNRQHFMRDFQSLLATQLKALHGRDERGFFAGRYDCEPLADRGPLIDEIARVVCRPCAAGLVAHPGDWPGISSWSQHANNDTRVVRREDRQLYWELRQKHPDLDAEQASNMATSTYVMDLTPPFDGPVGVPQLAAIRAIEELARRHDTDRPGQPVGAPEVLTWSPRERPRRPIPRRQRRRCIASNEQTHQRFVEKRWNANLKYESGCKRLRTGLPNAEFPRGMIPPHKVDAVGAREPPASRVEHPAPSTHANPWFYWPSSQGAA